MINYLIQTYLITCITTIINLFSNIVYYMSQSKIVGFISHKLTLREIEIAMIK